MNNIFSEKIFWAIGIVVVLISVLAKFRVAENKRKKEVFKKASDRFNNAFKDFLAMLESGFRYQMGPFVAPIPEHLAAAIVFRQHLWWFRRKCFDRKMDQYKQAAEKYDDEEQYLGVKNISHDTTLKLKKRIYALLKYAKPK